MRKRIRYATMMMLVAIATFLNVHQNASGARGEMFPEETPRVSSVNLDLNAFMPVEEIKPGMKGIGKTVFSGTQVEEFQVEIVGVLKNVTPRGDMILAKVTGGPLPLERTGVIAGMSGSPIYIQGRLVGALAYTLSIFQTEPMAGITPISEMLEEYERNKPDIDWGKGSTLKADHADSQFWESQAGNSLGQGVNVSNRTRMFNFWNSVMDNWAYGWDFQNQVPVDGESDWDLESEIQRLKSQSSISSALLRTGVRSPWSVFDGFPFEGLSTGNLLHQMAGNGQRTIDNRQLYSPSFIPIKTPLTISGVDERVIQEMIPLLDRFGIIPVQGGGVASLYEAPQDDKSEVDQLLPGSALGVQLIRGDMSASGFGTVTYVNRDHLIAFGHPMFSAGKVDIPMTSAYVHMIMANQINSFKIASPLSLKGSIRQDRRTGIMGVMGSSPSMVPLKVIVESEKDRKKNEYNFEVINDDFFAPLFVRISCLNAIFASEKEIGDATVKIQAEVYLKNRPPIVQKNIFSGNGASLLASLASVRSLGMLMSNPFEDIEVEKILITLSVAEKLEIAQIQGIRMSKDVLKPGESVRLTIFIQPFHGELIAQKLDVAIPENIPKGELKLTVCDSRAVNALEKFRAPLNFEPKNLVQLISLLETEEQNNEIIVQLLHSKAGVTIRGREFSSPPLSFLSIMNSSRHSGEAGLTRGTLLMQQRIPTNYVISGCELLTITVDDRYGMNSDMENNSKAKKGDSL